MHEFLRYRVEHVMAVKPVTVRANTPLSEIAELFDRHDFNALPVLGEDGIIVGVVSKLDFLEAFAFPAQSVAPPYQEILEQPAETVMRRAVMTVEPNLPLTDVLGRMVASRHKSFPVVDDGRLVGILAREDIVGAIQRAAAGEVPQENTSAEPC